METIKKKNLENSLRDVFASAEMTLDEVVALAKEVYNEEKAVNTAVSVQGGDIRSGMYVYDDNFISAELIVGRQVKAVVGYVEEDTVYAVCLRQAQMPWSSGFLAVKETQTMHSGKEATLKILETAETSGKTAEAAQWCHEYTYDGVKKGEAFLPSIDELKKLYKSKGAINNALKKIRADLLKGRIWSSSEYVFYGVWLQNFINGTISSHGKGYANGCVRSVLALRL